MHDRYSKINITYSKIYFTSVESRHYDPHMEERMKTFVKTAAIAAVLAVMFIVAVPVQAGGGGTSPSLMKNSGGIGDLMQKPLDRLEAAGYDVGAIRAAVESGDMETARTLLHELMEAHKEEFPLPSEKCGRMQKQSSERGNRMENHLDRLEEAGYDVISIRAAVENNDMETARTLLQEFMEEHKDEFPVPFNGERPGNGRMKARATASK